MLQRDKFFTAKCKVLYNEYGEVIDGIINEINNEEESERISEETAFAYAKKMIAKESKRKALIRFKEKLAKYAGYAERQ